jgi:hypothetical protein
MVGKERRDDVVNSIKRRKVQQRKEEEEEDIDKDDVMVIRRDTTLPVSLQEDIDSATTSPTKAHPKPSQTDDLMARLYAFLPQIQAANHTLINDDDAAAAAKQRQLDLHLEKESDSDDTYCNEDDICTDDDEEDDRKQSAAKKGFLGNQEIDIDGVGGTVSAAMDPDDANPRTKKIITASPGPTIQLQFTIGDMTNNPMMSLLQKAEGDDSDDEFGVESAEGATIRRLDAVADLLRKGKESTADTSTVKRFNNSKRKCREPLIREL